MNDIHFVDGQHETLPRNGILLIVGPNNSGKSSLLREMHGHLVSGSLPYYDFTPRWLLGLEGRREGSAEELAAWFQERARPIPAGMHMAGELTLTDTAAPSGGQYNFQAALQDWLHAAGLGNLGPFLVSFHDAMSRGQLLGAAGARNAMSPAQNPLHRLWDDRELEKKLSRLIQRAFGFPVSINRYAQTVELLMGDPGMPDEALPASRELLEAYARLRSVQTQGDGVRSFAGLLLATIGAGVQVVFVDEPEAFLHPPQARLLGRYLASEAGQGGQVVLVTHSAEVVVGVLEGCGERPVKIVRLDEDSDGQRRVHGLRPEYLKGLWADPLIRYSGMLEGLFHKGVVICESDGDSIFYSATLDHWLDGSVEHDLKFVHVGGKARLAAALRHVRELGVRAAVIGDIDVINDLKLLRGLVAAAGGDFGSVRDDAELVRAEAASREAPPTVRRLKSAVLPPLQRRESSALTEQEVSAVRESVKARSGWGEAKRSGVRAFDGQVGEALRRVIHALSEMGVFLVPVGELERWYPDVQAAHGNGYVARVLESRRHEKPTPELSAFLADLANFFSIALP